MKGTDQLYDFLYSYKNGVLATVGSDGTPSSAIIGFGQTHDLELLFGTETTSRKYKNLTHNPHIAFTVGGETAETIQYEGIARELNESEYDVLLNNYWLKNPHAKKYHASPNQRYFTVAPTWIRYTDMRSGPSQITELTF
ncbi:MAG: hypothetical protein JWM81_1093 [Candidatus Saccharibacteria bacterium]|nr:hypothetical protein [Candidatus Saccharibacteria bacterium]